MDCSCRGKQPVLMVHMTRYSSRAVKSICVCWTAGQLDDSARGPAQACTAQLRTWGTAAGSANFEDLIKFMEELLDESFVEYMKMKLPALVQAMLTLAANAPEWQVTRLPCSCHKQGAWSIYTEAQQHR